MEVLNENLLFDAEQHSFALEESTQNDQKFYRIRGKFATIEKLNNNKRIYPRALWEREVAKYQSEIENGTVNTLMEWEHPVGRTKVDPKNAVAKIEKLWIEGDYVMGEAVIFDTQQAETIKNMIRHGVKISVSSRATGGVGAGGIVSSFNLITFDIVTNPSDQSATMSGIFESEENSEEANKMADEKLMENLVSILRTKNVEIRDLNEEIDILRDEIQTIRNHPLYNEMAVPPMHNYGMERHQDVSSTLNDTDPSGYYASGEDHEPVIRKLIDQFNKTDEIGSQLDTDVYIQDRYASINESEDLDNLRELVESFDSEEYIENEIMHTLNEASIANIRDFIKVLSKQAGCTVEEHDYSFDGEYPEFVVKDSRDLRKVSQLKPGTYGKVKVTDVEKDPEYVIFELSDGDKVEIIADLRVFESVTASKPTNRFLSVASHLL